MQISFVPLAQHDPLALGKRDEAGAPGAGSTPQTAPLVARPTGEHQAAVVEILTRYDVTDISPAEFSEMIQKLYEAGAIAEDDVDQLARIRLDLEAAGLEPHDSLDLLEFYVERIQKLQRRLSESEGPGDGTEQLGPLLRRLDWIEKFALIQSAPDSIGLDAVA
jgi:hypothetical protein